MEVLHARTRYGRHGVGAHVRALKAALPGGIRVTADAEDAGLDLTQHAESGYALERL
jgi:ammonia channel protein AmtB